MSSEIVLASTQLSQRLGVEKGAMIATIKAQCFKGKHPDQVTEAQLAAFVSTAQAIGVNPLLPGMLYAYPEQNGGITPIIGPDGIFSMLASNPEIEGWTAKHETIDGEKACTATIKHKRLGDISKTVFLSEWQVQANPNWRTRPRHMLEIRALKQCARQVIHGVPLDDDEHKEAMKNVTATAGQGADASVVETVTPPADGGAPAAPADTNRPKPPARRGGARAAAEIVTETEEEKAAKKVSPEGSGTSPAPSAAGQPPAAAPAAAAEPTSTPTETKAATPAPAADPKSAPKDVKAAGVAQETPAAGGDDYSKVPECAPGVGMAGFHGQPWPRMLNLEVVSTRFVVTPQKTPLAIITANVEGHEGGTLDLVTLENVAIKDGQPFSDSPLYVAGKNLNGKVQARLRNKKTDIAPALWIEGITEVAEEF